MISAASVNVRLAKPAIGRKSQPVQFEDGDLCFLVAIGVNGRSFRGRGRSLLFLNDAVIVAEQAHRIKFGSVAILNVNCHHANGTKDIFAADLGVLFLSIHVDPMTDYPLYWGMVTKVVSVRNRRAAEPATVTAARVWLADVSIGTGPRTGSDQAFGTRLLVPFGTDTDAGDPISQFGIPAGRLPRGRISHGRRL